MIGSETGGAPGKAVTDWPFIRSKGMKLIKRVRLTVTLFLSVLCLTGVPAAALAEDGTTQPGETLRTCGGQPFSLSVFSAPAGYQEEATGLAASLRYEISIDRTMPRRGWRVIQRGRDWAELIAGKPKREGNVWLLFKKNDAGKWGVEEGWFGCWFSPAREGASVGEWYVADGQRITAGARSLKVDVYEMECNSGKAAIGRVMKPVITYRPDWIVVTYFVRWKKDSGPEYCPLNPPVKKTLKLSEPLGDRTILDGGFYPYPRRYPVGRAPG